MRINQVTRQSTNMTAICITGIITLRRMSTRTAIKAITLTWWRISANASGSPWR